MASLPDIVVNIARFTGLVKIATNHSITVASKVSLSQQMPVQFHNWELVRGLFDHFALVLT